jgi:hypothetical protein
MWTRSFYKIKITIKEKKDYFLFLMPVITNQYTSPGAKPTISGIQTAIDSATNDCAMLMVLSKYHI